MEHRLIKGVDGPSCSCGFVPDTANDDSVSDQWREHFGFRAGWWLSSVTDTPQSANMQDEPSIEVLKESYDLLQFISETGGIQRIKWEPFAILWRVYGLDGCVLGEGVTLLNALLNAKDRHEKPVPAPNALLKAKERYPKPVPAPESPDDRITRLENGVLELAKDIKELVNEVKRITYEKQ